MHDDKPDPFVDDLLETSLKRYHGEEPRSGLEMRILAGIRSRERAARRRWLGWAVAACAGILAIIVLTLHFAPTRHRQPTPRAELSPEESGAHRAPIQPPQQQVRRVAAHHSRPEQLPTPLLLTEQEKLLLEYLSKTSKGDLAEETNRTDEAPVTDLEISKITIAPLEIKPLNDSQTELGK